MHYSGSYPSPRKMKTEELLVIQKVFEHWLNPIVVTDHHGTIQFVNPAFTRITGYSPQEIIGENPRVLKSSQHSTDFYENLWKQITEKGSWYGEIRNRNKNGDIYSEWKTIFAIQNEDGHTTHYAAIAHNVDHIKEQQLTFHLLPDHGELASLPNDRLLSRTYKANSMEKDLPLALLKEEFELYYQPRVDMKSEAIAGAEALIRWNHPHWGLVSPIDFIPLAEKTGFISDIEEWVKFTACKQIKEWQQAGFPSIPISINVHAQKFMKRDFSKRLHSILDQIGVDGKWLEIEITESFRIQNTVQVRETIEQLRNLGIKISLDDFGTGYSSLFYLTQFPIDILKIDKSFIRESTTKPEITTILQSIIQMAHGLQLEIVAEGVEMEEQLALLRQLECHYIQGYLFSPPVPVSEFSRMLEHRVLNKKTTP